MTPRAIDLYKQAHDAHLRLTQTVMQLETEARNCGDTVELADLGYALREANKLMEDSCVELRKLQKMTSQLFCLLWAMDPLAQDRVRTDWCTCAGVVKTVCNPPSQEKDPELFEKLMTALGVPEEAVKTGALKLSFDGLGDWMTHAQRQGMNLPKECEGTTFKDYRLHIIARRKLSSELSEASIVDDGPDDGEETAW